MTKTFITKLQPPTGLKFTLPTASDPSPSANPPIINDALNVRLKVFVEGQKCDPADEIDDDEARSWHWVTYDNEIPEHPVPVATIRLIPPPQVPHESLLDSERGAEWPKYDLHREPAIRLGRLGCLDEYRGYGLGKAAILTALEWARQHPAEINRVFLDCLRQVGADVHTIPGGKWSGLVLGHAQAHVEKMYERLGFVTYGQLGIWEGFEHAVPSANPLAPFTSLWIQWKRFQGQEVPAFASAFQKKGPFVRIGPNEVALNTIDAVRTVHGYGRNNYSKPPWYSVFQHLDAANSFSSLTGDHNIRRHRISSVYTKPFVQGSQHVQHLLGEVLQGRLLPLIASHAQEGQPVEVLSTGFAYSLDFVSAWLFGLPRGTNFLADAQARDEWLDMYANVYSSPMFWLQEYPTTISWLSKIGLHIVPKSYFQGCQVFDSWVVPRVKACEKRFSEANGWGSQDYPVVYAQLRSAMAAEQDSKTAEKFTPTESQIQELGSECLDHMVATRDTFGVVLSYILLYISRHPAEQSRLIEELRLAQQNAQGSDQPLSSASTLESLPFLNAVLKESIRLRGNVPTSNPRIVSSSAPVQLGPYSNISEVRVSALAWCLHRNEEIFPDPESWVPDRWMVNPSTKMDATEQDKWFWAFGSGSRRCLGQNLAMEVLRFTVAAIYSEFETHIHDESRFINEDGFVTGKAGERLDLIFKRVPSTA